MVCRSCGIDYGIVDDSDKEEVKTPPSEEE